MIVALPHIGRVLVVETKSERGHFLWLSRFGWHDCTRTEDRLILQLKGRML
jgi:hypothetical protein